MGPDRTEFVKAEFHCHTIYSKDSLLKLEDLLLTCQKKGINRLVVTDHNTIQGGTQAHALDPHLFITGEEIMTQQGELIGIFMKENIPSGLPAQTVIDLLHKQGAFISVSHPFDTFRAGHWEPADLLNIIDQVDAIEVFNSRCMRPIANAQALDFCLRHNLLATVGSDAHYAAEVGAATLLLPDFDGPETLKKALQVAQSRLRLSPPWVHFYSRYAAWRKRLSS